MNLNRVLNEALPDLPPPRLPDVYPRVHPRLLVRMHEEIDGPMYIAVVPEGSPIYFRLPPLGYEAVKLFDGNRSYEEVATLFQTVTGVATSAQELRDFADTMEKSGFWYRTPQEESALLCKELIEQRQKKIKRKNDLGDLSTIYWWSFDPDNYLTWVHEKCKFLYSPWFFAWSLVMTVIMCVILGSRWSEVWADSVDFYTLTGHGVSHVLEFFAAFLLLGVFHETAHGLTCKHFGGEVHGMGVFTIYLVPGVFCDVKEVFVYGDRCARMATAAAGVWSEIVLASYASVVWWATPPGSSLHQAAYLVILSGGIFCVLINWNPLSRMDGYYLLSEYYRIPNLKGDSTAYLSSWVRKNIFRMPATVPILPPLRRVSYITYAILSGVYCYSMLLFFSRIIYHVLYYYSPQWAFLPASALTVLIFRSRIRKLVQFMRELYLNKRSLLRAHWKTLAAAAAIVIALGFIPLRRERVEGRFVLEPVQRAIVRTEVPGRVTEVLADEGQFVGAGASVARLRDLSLDSEAARALSDYRIAAAQAIDAQLHYRDYGVAEQQRRRFAKSYDVIRERQQHLLITTPVAGVIVTPRIHDLLGSYIQAGTQIAEVADVSSLRARVYVPQPEMHKLEYIHSVALRANSSWLGVTGQLESISPIFDQPPIGLFAVPAYRGVRPPSYFSVTVILQNQSGELRDGMGGLALIYGVRRSLFAVFLEPAVEAIERRFW